MPSFVIYGKTGLLRKEFYHLKNLCKLLRLQKAVFAVYNLVAFAAVKSENNSAVFVPPRLINGLVAVTVAFRRWNCRQRLQIKAAYAAYVVFYPSGFDFCFRRIVNMAQGAAAAFSDGSTCTLNRAFSILSSPNASSILSSSSAAAFLRFLESLSASFLNSVCFSL